MVNDDPPTKMSRFRGRRLAPEQRAEVLARLVVRHTALCDAEVKQLDAIFKDIYDAHKDETRKQVQRWRLGEATTKDLLQESWIDLYRALIANGFPSNLAAYLRVIVLRKVLNFVRRQANCPEPECLPSSGSEPARSAPQSALDRALDARALAENMLSQLTPEQERLFDLIFRQELSFSDACAALDLPEGTVKARGVALKKVLVVLAANFASMKKKEEEAAE